jgi:hypothetical protein
MQAKFHNQKGSLTPSFITSRKTQSIPVRVVVWSLSCLMKELGRQEAVQMPTNTGEAREIKDRANANEAETVRESKTLARKVKADLNKTRKAPVDRPRPQGSKSKN